MPECRRLQGLPTPEIPNAWSPVRAQQRSPRGPSPKRKITRGPSGSSLTAALAASICGAVWECAGSAWAARPRGLPWPGGQEVRRTPQRTSVQGWSPDPRTRLTSYTDLTTYPEFSPSRIPSPCPLGKEIQGKCFLCTYSNSQMFFNPYFQTVCVLLAEAQLSRTHSIHLSSRLRVQLSRRGRAGRDAFPLPEPAFPAQPRARPS